MKYFFVATLLFLLSCADTRKKEVKGSDETDVQYNPDVAAADDIIPAIRYTPSYVDSVQQTFTKEMQAFTVAWTEVRKDSSGYFITTYYDGGTPVFSVRMSGKYHFLSLLGMQDAWEGLIVDFKKSESGFFFRTIQWNKEIKLPRDETDAGMLHEYQYVNAEKSVVKDGHGSLFASPRLLKSLRKVVETGPTE